MSIITVQRGSKSGGEELAVCLSESLGYPLLGREVLQEAAAELGVPVEDVGERMEGSPGLFGRVPLITRLYVAAVSAALAEHALDGKLVYHGLAGGFLLREVPGILRVRLIAPMGQRIQALMQNPGFDEASAEAYIKDVDDARARWVNTVYGQDNTDPSRYDMVVNLASFSPSEACEVVVHAAQSQEFEMTPDRLEKLRDFHMTSQVRLALLEDLGTQTLDLEVTVSGGLASVSGEAPVLKTGEVGKRIHEIATSVEGVKKVRLAMDWFDPYP
jgi:cytidylate kinase